MQSQETTLVRIKITKRRQPDWRRTITQPRFMKLTPKSVLINHRTEELAMVVLTRRSDVLPTRIDVGGLDLFAKILSAADSGKVEDPGIGFGVVFAGTSKPLSTASEATAFANRKFKAVTLRQFTFFFPVIA